MLALTKHIFIVITLNCILFYLCYLRSHTIKNILILLLISNFLLFYGTLFIFNSFNYKIHLPLHLCYLTEFLILLSILFRNKLLYPWLLLNSILGGTIGMINTNLTTSSLAIEVLHYYLSHFNLLLFAILIFKTNFYLTKSKLVRSIVLNAMAFISIIFFNFRFNTNYWFTVKKPEGLNLSFIFPEWPYYLLVLIAIGLSFYIFSYSLFLKNKVKA